MTAVRTAAAVVPRRRLGTAWLRLTAVFSGNLGHTGPRLSAHLLDDAAVSWDFCCSAQIAHKGTKVRANDRARPRRLHLQRPISVWCVRRSVIAEDERTGHLKGCLVGLVWLGPGAAAWAAHRVSQVCLSALDESTSECEGGDCQQKSRAFIVHYVMSPNGQHTPQNNTHRSLDCGVITLTCMCYCSALHSDLDFMVFWYLMWFHNSYIIPIIVPHSLSALRSQFGYIIKSLNMDG